MINANVVRETENASRLQDINKQPPSNRRTFRMKSSALSDVQNTLHSRPNQFDNPTNSGIKAPSKPSGQLRGWENNILPRKKISFEGKPKPAEGRNTLKELNTVPNIHSDDLEYHNHILCEQAERTSANDFLFPYKFSDLQINTLTKSVKNFVTPVSYKVAEPCKDIKLPFIKETEDTFSVSDIFNDILPIEIDAPTW